MTNKLYYYAYLLQTSFIVKLITKKLVLIIVQYFFLNHTVNAACIYPKTIKPKYDKEACFFAATIAILIILFIFT